jgi:outer membrane protein OmpA-like peptidoglycan-associated protein
MSEITTRTEIIVYKGFLECQFSDIKKHPIGNSNKNSRIRLEPRFKLHKAEIVDSFPTKKEILDNQAYVHQMDEIFPIECHFISNKNKSGRYFANEVLLILESSQFNLEENNIGKFKDILAENKIEYLNEPFLSSSQDKQHGKICGEAYFKVVKKFNEKNEEIKFETDSNGKVIPNVGDIGNSGINSGCMPFISYFKKVFDNVFAFNNYVKKNINNISSKIFNKKLINDNPPDAGCMNAMLPSGCSSSGCSQFGCGCLSLLLALAFLIWFIWCILLGKCNQNDQVKVSDTKIIHDTVYVEVNKTKVDTIIKKDTIIYEDKTTKTKISVVSLPNVQFEKNKAKLLDSSKEDLDKLAKHLIENKQVKAEIIGHTDGSGEAVDNLKLSQERAESVRQYLIKSGVEASRITAVGKGETEPKTTNETAEGRAMNRRVEVKLSETEKVEQTRKRVKKESK